MTKVRKRGLGRADFYARIMHNGRMTEDDMKALEALSLEDAPLAEAIIITPEMAQRMLKQNEQNRSVSINLVRQYADEMRSGKWQLNGETIKIAPNGDLVDGQHRLHACIQAKAPFPTMLMRGVDRESFDTIDTGRKRTAGDALTVDGTKNANNVAAAAKWVVAIKQGGNTGRGVRLTAHDTRQFIYENQTLEESVVKARSSNRNILPLSMLGALHFLFAEKDMDEANAFLEDFGAGANLAADDPVFVLRDRLLRDKMGQRKVRLPDQEKFALVIRAWNARRSGKRAIGSLRGLVRKSDGTYQMPAIA